MKTKTATHTPGLTIEKNPEKYGESYTVIDQNFNFYAKTYSLPTARLIAAAPELLEAAKIISNWIERVAEEVTMGPDDNKALNNLRAAIAKAEGRE